MSDERLRGLLPAKATRRQVEALAAYVETGGSVVGAAALLGIQPGTVKRHLADLRARLGLATEQLIYCGRADGWLLIAGLETRRERPAVT